MRGQAGQSVIELILAIFLISTVFLALVAGMFAINRGTLTNEQAVQVNTAMVSYGEILRDRDLIDYEPCTAVGQGAADALAAAYQAAVAAPGVTDPTGEPGAVEQWRRPDGVELAVTEVEAWDDTAQQFVAGCRLPDRGLQRITYQAAFDGSLLRVSQVVKRETGPTA